MYEKNGEKYFVVDGHMHFWDASRENWVEGRENLAKGWIDCFYGYHTARPAGDPLGLGALPQGLRGRPDEGRLRGRPRRQGHLPVDLPEVLVQGRLQHRRSGTPRCSSGTPTSSSSTAAGTPGTARPGSSSSRRTPRRWNLKGVKLYTAEWHENGSRGWKLTDKESYRFLEKCQELGITNIHAHKGPTIWPLNKDAFSMEDVDQTATDFPDLNFIIEHAGIPRIDDFAYMAVQEPNVYAGCSVVIGAHMHARPEVLRQVHGRAAVLGRRGPPDLRQRLQHLDAEVAGRGLRRLADARRRGVLRLPAAHHRHQEEDPRPERGQALRHRGAAGVPAARAAGDPCSNEPGEQLADTTTPAGAQA